RLLRRPAAPAPGVACRRQAAAPPAVPHPLLHPARRLPALALDASISNASLLTPARRVRGAGGGAAMTRRQPCPPAPRPLGGYAAAFDPLFATLAQRRGFREYLQGLRLPRDRNKTLTALAGAEPVVGAHGAAVQRLQWFLSEASWDAEAVNARRLAL